MRKKSINIVFSWLLSYISILIIPIVIILLSYLLSVSVIEEEINKTHAASLQQMNQMMESTFYDIYKMAIEIALNDNNISIIRYPEGDLTATQKYDASIFISNLRTLKLANGNIDEICIYYKNNNIILTDNGIYKIEDYYDLYIKKAGLPYEDWIEQLKAPQQNIFTSIKSVGSTNQIEDRISYIRSLPFEIYSESNATLMILINKYAVYNWLDQLEWVQPGYIYIIDSKNNVIVSTGEAHLDFLPISYENLNENKKTLETDINGEDVIVSYTKSNITGWKYVAVIPKNVYLKKAQLVRNVMICSIFFCLLAGGILAWIFTKRNYKPLRAIASMIYQHKRNIPKFGYTNEWYLINNAIKNYINENESLQKKLTDQMPIIRNYFFTRLLSGEIRDINAVKTMTNFLKLDINFYCFTVILIMIDGNKKLKSNNSEPAQEIIRVTIENIAEEFYNKAGRGYAVDIGKDKTAIIVALSQNNERSNYERLKKITEELYSFLKGKFNLGITVAISNIHNNFLDLASAYSEAQNALDYKIIKGEDAIIFFEELGNSVSSYNYSFKEETKIINYLRLGDFSKIKEVLENIIDNLKSTPVSLEFAKCIYFEIVNTAIKSVNELEISINAEEYLPIILSKKTLDEVYSEVCNLYYEMCNQVRMAKQLRNDRLKENVIHFMGENYRDKQLSLEYLAREFNVSVSYMSRFFNEQIGYCFIDYVHYLRLCKAKELLARSDINIGQIAEKVGYNSAYNFTRVFKRYENITPTEYRLSMENVPKTFCN